MYRSTDVSALNAPDLLAVLRRVELRGTFELAYRIHSISSRVLRYARATGRKCEDVAADLIGLLFPVEPENMAAIVDPLQIGQLLRAMDGYSGEPLTRFAHSDHNKVRKAYNHAKYLPQRREMMQSWADFVDALRLKTDMTVVARSDESPWSRR